MEIIEKSKMVRVESYSYEYEWDNEKGAGFSFPCDKEGNIKRSKMYPEGLANLKDCQRGIEGLTDKGVRDDSYSYRQNAVGCCECGNTVELYDPLTNECGKCGRLYNMSGQELAPRSQWEETIDEEPGLFSDDDIETASYF